MPDGDGRILAGLVQVVGGGLDIEDVGLEIRVGEVAVGAPQPREVEAQGRDPPVGERLGDAAGGHRVLAEREAVDEQRVGARLVLRKLQPCGQLVALGAGELDPLRMPRHRPLSPSPRRRAGAGCRGSG